MTQDTASQAEAREVLADISEYDGHHEAAKRLRDPNFVLNVEDGSATTIAAMLAFSARSAVSREEGR